MIASNLIFFKDAEKAKKIDDLKKLYNMKEISGSDFADTIYSALTYWNISETDFRNMFALSKGTVHRWSVMKNLPQPDIRPIILKWVYDQITSP